MNFKKLLPGNRRGNHGHRGLFILSRELRAHGLDVQACAPCGLPFAFFAFFVEWETEPVQESGPRVQLFSVPEQLTEGGLDTAVWLSAE